MPTVFFFSSHLKSTVFTYLQKAHAQQPHIQTQLQTQYVSAPAPFLGNYTLNSPGGHSVSGLFGSGLQNGHGVYNGHGVPGPGCGPGGGGLPGGSGGPHSFLNGGNSSMANLGLMTPHNSHMPPANIHSQSPTSVLSNYSLNRNLNQLNLNLVPRTNR